MTAQSQEELLAAHLEEQKIDVTSLPFDICFIFAMFMKFSSLLTFYLLFIVFYEWFDCVLFFLLLLNLCFSVRVVLIFFRVIY